MRWIVPVVVVAAILESIAIRGFVIGGVRVELVLILVAAWAALRGWEEGLLLGVIGGILIDVLSAAPFGISALRLGLIGFGTGFVISRMAHGSPLIPIAAAACGSLAGFVLNVMALQASGWTVAWERSLVVDALPSAI